MGVRGIPCERACVCHFPLAGTLLQCCVLLFALHDKQHASKDLLSLLRPVSKAAGDVERKHVDQHGPMLSA
jgi:hypothetical protein